MTDAVQKAKSSEASAAYTRSVREMPMGPGSRKIAKASEIIANAMIGPQVRLG